MKRPDCIRHWRDVEGPDDATYPDSNELFSIGAPLARRLGLSRMGIHHERLPPGRRTSYPHAESDEEEFVYVLEVWGGNHFWTDRRFCESAASSTTARLVEDFGVLDYCEKND
jgi:uncharacterized cupin superfamily protein